MYVLFDWEVFPHWNCMVYAIYDKDPNEKLDMHVITSDDPDYVYKLREVSKLNGFENLTVMTGFNIKSYDMQIYDLACMGYTPEELYEHSMSIINSNDGKYKWIRYWNKYAFTDLMDDIKMGSLKQFESNVGMMVHESTVPFGKVDLTEEEKEDIVSYCKHDVYAVSVLLRARWSYILSKLNVSKLSSLSEKECLKNTSAKVCAKMLGAKQRPTLMDPYYEIPERLEPIFTETLHPTILDNFIGQELVNDFTYTVDYMKNRFIFGAGGVHSTYKDELVCVSDDDHVLVVADFENLYPAEMDEFDYFPAGVPADGKKQFSFILSDCRRLKSELRTMKKSNLGHTPEYNELFGIRDSEKLIMNAATGAQRAKFSPLYDPENIIALCFTGQLLTVSAAKLVHNLGALVLQTNTDGIVYKIHKDKLVESYDILTEFAKKVGIPLEIETQYAIFQKNVNNYILLASKTAEPKLKGRWAKQSGSDVPLTPLFAPIINQSIIDYYRDGTPVEDTIRNGTNALDYMMTTMKGPTYTGVIKRDEHETTVCQNINRVYATVDKSQGTLFKIREDSETGEIVKEDKIASIPVNCRIFNDEVTADTKLTDLDFNWYIEFAKRNLVDMVRV